MGQGRLPGAWIFKMISVQSHQFLESTQSWSGSLACSPSAPYIYCMCDPHLCLSFLKLHHKYRGYLEIKMTNANYHY